jgi:hypothetical protein
MTEQKQTLLPNDVADKIGPYYVYALVDPTNDEIFYVGKGTKERLLAHGRDAELRRLNKSKVESQKLDRIDKIKKAGSEVRIDVIRHGIEDEETALLIEAALIDALPNLLNEQRGHGVANGRSPMRDLIERYGAEDLPLNAPPALLIRLKPWQYVPEGQEMEKGVLRFGYGYRPGMSDSELLDATRGWWRINPERAASFSHAIAVVHGVTKLVLRIGDQWTHREDDRWCFTAELDDDAELNKIWIGPRGRRIPFSRGDQSAIRYWTH